MRGLFELSNAAWEEIIPALNISPRELFAGNQAAYDAALTYLRVAGTWDDLIDGDKVVSHAEIHYSYIAILIDLNKNPFYLQFKPQIDALVTTAVLGYLTANVYENTQDEHGIELGHFLRYSGALIVGYIVYLCHGFPSAVTMWPTLMKALCNDRFDHYVAEILSRGAGDAG